MNAPHVSVYGADGKLVFHGKGTRIEVLDVEGPSYASVDPRAIASLLKSLKTLAEAYGRGLPALEARRRRCPRRHRESRGL